MGTPFDEISEQIHGIRNMLAPMAFKLDDLDHKMADGRVSFDRKVVELEARISADSLRISELTNKLSEHVEQMTAQSERIRKLESLLKVATTVEIPASAPSPAPVHEDKQSLLATPPPPPKEPKG